MVSVFFIERTDHECDDENGDFGFTNILSVHVTLKAANKAAKVLLYKLFIDEDDGEIAAITKEKIRGDGTYLGTYRLSDEDLDPPGTDCVTLSVVKMDVKDESWSPYEDENDEQEFVKETSIVLTIRRTKKNTIVRHQKRP
ncbi:hypothetical protein CPB83DRAFT_843108 [Crepidotus variabilis]|uniref:Uncharacterized protein n=1 Tax=Crepidotus variabilis TaxID=179855 RepID=A0A9P6JWQ1_9AGAR|nr:hypothetical protein CPB83DRAFT_843108 [Crepidotus variabilis]